MFVSQRFAAVKPYMMLTFKDSVTFLLQLNDNKQ